MGKRKTNLKLVLMTMLLVFSVIMLNQGTFSDVKVAQAATKKASISATKLTIPVGKLSKGDHWQDVKTWDRGVAEKLTVKNKVKGATYTFTSSDKKIVTVAKDGGYLTGVKAGTATITCKQTLNKKTTVVGTCKVTVKKANMVSYTYSGSDGHVVAIGEGQYDYYSWYAGMDAFYYIGYRNPSAKYTLKTNSADFTMEEAKFTDKQAEEFAGLAYVYGYKYNAKKAGVYTVEVEETYNKKTTKLGSFKVEVKDTYVDSEEYNLRKGDTMNVFSFVHFAKPNTMYYFTVENYDSSKPESNVATLWYDDYDTEREYLLLKGQVPGNATVTVREGSETGNVIGTIKVKVYEAVCENILVYSDATTYVGDEYFYFYYELQPYDTTDEVTFESDNPDVLKVVFDEYNGWEFKPLKVGTANVTIKCGSKTEVTKVTVVESEEDIW